MPGELGNPIASGRTSEIYGWDEEHILKLFYDWVEPESIENEARISRVIHETGLPIPKVGEIVRVDGRIGLIYQRVQGTSLWTVGKHKPWNIPRYLRRAAELHAEMHAHTISADLPSQRQVLEKDIQQAEPLPGPLRSRVLAALQEMPDGKQLCHGDFWPGNILVSPHGDIIIDWYRASYGNPLADLARTVNSFLAFIKSDQMKRPFLSYGDTKVSQVKNALFRLTCRMTYPVYVRRYFQLSPGGQAEYRRWLPIVAAARLADGVPEFEKMLTEQVENGF